MRPVTVQVVDNHVSDIRFERDAVIAIVDADVVDHDVGAAVHIDPVGLAVGFASTGPGVGAGNDVHVLRASQDKMSV